MRTHHLSPIPRHRLRSLLDAALIALLLAQQACGTSSSGDHAGAENSKLTVRPEAATLGVGQTVQFTAGSPWGGEVRWSVLPATCGTFGQDGLFTAGGVAGTCTILARLVRDVRYTAAATLMLLPASTLSADLWAALVGASGGSQASPDGAIRNVAVLGEAVNTFTATDASRNLQVRYGFLLPGARP
jgi:hypothetical protein